jgi:hypothetical protein
MQSIEKESSQKDARSSPRNFKRGPSLRLRQSVSALPQTVEPSCEEEKDVSRDFELLEKCIADAKKWKKTRVLNEDKNNNNNPLGKWLAQRRAKSKEKKILEKSACYHYYDARSPRGKHFGEKCPKECMLPLLRSEVTTRKTFWRKVP